MAQIRTLIDELFQERVAGTIIGDVFEAGDDDVFSIRLHGSGGLEKSDSQLKVKTSNGTTVTADGIKAVGDPATDNVLAVSATGIKVPNAKIWPVGSVYFNTTGVNPNTELGYGTWVCLGTGNLTLT